MLDRDWLPRNRVLKILGCNMLENNSEYRCFPCCLGEHIKRMNGTILEAVRNLKFVLARAISLVAATFEVARNWLCPPAMLAHPNEESCFWERHKEASYAISHHLGLFLSGYIYIYICNASNQDPSTAQIINNRTTVCYHQWFTQGD